MAKRLNFKCLSVDKTDTRKFNSVMETDKYHTTTAAAVVLATELGSVHLKVTIRMKEDIKFLSIKDDALQSELAVKSAKLLNERLKDTVCVLFEHLRMVEAYKAGLTVTLLDYCWRYLYRATICFIY